MTGGGSAPAAAAAVHGHAADNGSQSPASALFPAFSQHMQLVERAGGRTDGGGSMVVAARRAALSSLWEWLRLAGAGAEADAEAAARLHQLYRSVTAKQVALLCAIIRRASADGMENGAFACACFCCTLVISGADHNDQLLPLFLSLLQLGSMPVVAIRALLDIRTSTRVPKSTRKIIDSSGLQEKAMQVLPPLDTPTKQKAVSQLCAICTPNQLAQWIPLLLPFLQRNCISGLQFVLPIFSQIMQRGPSASRMLLQFDLSDRLVQLLRQRAHPDLQRNALILCAKLVKHLAGAEALLRAHLLHPDKRVLEQLLFGGDHGLADGALSLLHLLSACYPRKLFTEYAVGCIQRMLSSDAAQRQWRAAVMTVQAVVRAAKQPHQRRLLIHSGVIDELLQHIIPRCARTNEVIVSVLAIALEWPESGCDPTSPRMQRWCQIIAESRSKLAALEALVTPPGYAADSEWNNPPFYPLSYGLDDTLCAMRLLLTHIYSKQRMPTTRLVLQRQWKSGAVTTAMGVQAPLWFDAALAALVARQAERDAELDYSDYEFDSDMSEDEIEDGTEAEMDVEDYEDDEPFDPMRPPSPELVMTN